MVRLVSHPPRIAFNPMEMCRSMMPNVDPLQAFRLLEFCWTRLLCVAGTNSPTQHGWDCKRSSLNLGSCYRSRPFSLRMHSRRCLQHMRRCATKKLQNHRLFHYLGTMRETLVGRDSMYENSSCVQLCKLGFLLVRTYSNANMVRQCAPLDAHTEHCDGECTILFSIWSSSK